MRDALYQVVENGTAKKAKVEGYTIGGKTGTAEKLPRGNGKCLLSFIGFAPVENPQVVVYVTVDEPNVEDQASSGLGTIIAQSIFEELLPYMNIYQTEEAGSGDTTDNVGDEVAGPIYDGTVPEESISEDLGVTTESTGTESTATENTSETTESTGSTEGVTESTGNVEGVTETTTEQTAATEAPTQ
jgi:stage V sporulation protein D (sporulation-specific penicillin-binding protein)